jgi:hypothetical protein
MAPPSARTSELAYSVVTGRPLRTSGDYFTLVCDPAVPLVLAALALQQPQHAEECASAAPPFHAVTAQETDKSGCAPTSPIRGPNRRGSSYGRRCWDTLQDTGGPRVPESVADFNLWLTPDSGTSFDDCVRYEEPLWLRDLQVLRREAALHL